MSCVLKISMVYLAHGSVNWVSASTFFYFYYYFHLFYVPYLKIQDYDMLLHLRLVNIQLNGLICWTVGLHGVIRVRSALVVAPGDVASIECINDRPIPETSLAFDIPR